VLSQLHAVVNCWYLTVLWPIACYVYNFLILYLFILHLIRHAKAMHMGILLCLAGTTWLQQIVWLIVNGASVGNDDGLNMEQRFPYIEYEYPGLSEIRKRRSPRLIKSHLPYHCLPVVVEDGHGKVKWKLWVDVFTFVILFCWMEMI